MSAPEIDLVARSAECLLAMATGLAHGVAFSLIALPAKRVWMRMLIVPLGMWCGTFTALWIIVPEGGFALRTLVLVLGSITLTTWVLLPFYGRDRGFVVAGKNVVPSVRFACPRCGTRVDWSQGVAACTDCGLFLHILWPADELQERRRAGPEVAPDRTARFACPQCGVVDDWPCGEGTCKSCGLRISLHWNVHTHK
jgi:predicted RNA-binding Zn-ribbon protein involved in translation (DUF1610 family)